MYDSCGEVLHVKLTCDNGNVRASPLITKNGIVFVPSMDHRLYALALEPLAPVRKLWSLDLGGDISASPAIGSAGILYVGTERERLFAIGAPPGDP